jgi:hypothetical protein
MRTREHDWLDTKRKRPKYGFQVFHCGRWCHAAENGKPCIFDTKLQRDEKRAEFRKVRLTPNVKDKAALEERPHLSAGLGGKKKDTR